MKVKNAGLESQLKSLERDVDEQTNEATVSTVQQTYELQRSEVFIIHYDMLRTLISCVGENRSVGRGTPPNASSVRRD